VTDKIAAVDRNEWTDPPTVNATTPALNESTSGWTLQPALRSKLDDAPQHETGSTSVRADPWLDDEPPV